VVLKLCIVNLVFIAVRTLTTGVREYSAEEEEGNNWRFGGIL